MTDERMKMLDEDFKAAARKKKVDIVLARSKVGEARRREREAAERRDAVLRIQAGNLFEFAYYSGPLKLKINFILHQLFDAKNSNSSRSLLFRN